MLRGGFSINLKVIKSANSKSVLSIFFSLSAQDGRLYLNCSIIAFKLGNYFKPSAIAIKSLGLAWPAHALPESLSKSPIALSIF